jgi:hypothetical protein
MNPLPALTLISTLIISLSLMQTSIADSLTSIYTSTTKKHCKQQQDNQGRKLQCLAPKNYGLTINQGDQTQLTLITPNQNQIPIHASSLPNFANLTNDKIEWRLNHKQHPIALIYRLTGQAPHDAQQRQTVLVVVKINIDQACVVALIPAGKNDNQQAHDISNTIHTKQCLP